MAKVQTVLGEIAPNELGRVLPHEHTYFHWLGAEADHNSSYDIKEVVQKLSEQVNRVKEAHGLGTIVDVGTSDAGRNPELMVELSRQTQVHIVAATGFYTGSMAIPYYWRVRPLDALEEFIAREITEGIAGSRVKCGIIKLASGPELGTPLPERGSELVPYGGKLRPSEEKTFSAGARVQKRLGVTITTHTDIYDWHIDNPGLRQLDVLEREGADPSRCIIGHADSTTDISKLVEVMEQGASVGIDTVGYEGPQRSIRHRLGLVVALVAMGYEGQILLSHDTVMYERRRPGSKDDPQRYNGGNLGLLFEEFIPDLLKAGVSEKAVHQMTVDNPRRLLTF
jgi:phosphotriesterase-related protein